MPRGRIAPRKCQPQSASLHAALPDPHVCRRQTRGAFEYRTTKGRRLAAWYGPLSWVVTALVMALGVGTAAAEDYEYGGAAAANQAIPRVGPGAVQPGAKGDADDALPAVRRDPISIVLVDGDRRIVVAHAAAGSIMEVDRTSGHVYHESTVGRRLSQLVAWDGDRWLLAADEAAHTVLLIERTQSGFRVAQRLKVPHTPVGLAVDPARGTAYVASLWSRRLSVLDVQPGCETQPLRLTKVIDLPYAPRRLLLVEDGRRMIVADAFGGSLGIFDTARATLETVRQLPAHNIRGMALTADGNRVLISHQILNDLAETSHNDVHWGVLMTNVLRWIPLSSILDPEKTILAGSHSHLTGDNTSAGGDPAEVAVTTDGRAIVALAGVNEVGIGFESDFTLRRVHVGQRPSATAVTADGTSAVVANTFDDTLSVIDLAQGKVERVLVPGRRPQPSEVERGERLFYDARLALDGWFSCHSCHTDGHTTGHLTDNLSDQSFGDAKRILPLGAVGQTGPWAWNGLQTDLAAQVRVSVQSTMQGQPLPDDDIAALVAYLKTIEPPPSLSVARDEVNETAVAAGRQIFEARGCVNCHQPPHYTSEGAYDVGLADKLGNRLYNPPSLRGVSQRGPLFHDGRAKSLEDVLIKFRHQLEEPLSDEELRRLLAFLRSL